jgi:hypothetical protein
VSAQRQRNDVLFGTFHLWTQDDANYTPRGYLVKKPISINRSRSLELTRFRAVSCEFPIPRRPCFP